MELKKDKIWEVVAGANDFESFQKNILEPIYLKPQVPEDIKANISIVEKLLLHSYFEYEFIDLALSHAVFTLEKSLRIRYSEIHNASSKKLRFADLIDWFFDNTYFETGSKDVLTQLRNIRNGKVHNEKKTLGGLAFLRKTYSVFYLINDLYEDQKLRVIRKQETAEWQERFEQLINEGCIVSIDGKRRIVFKIDVIFLNNKINPSTLTLAIWPIFDPAPYKGDYHAKPGFIEVVISNWEITENTIKAINTKNNSEVIISKIADAVNKAKFEKWREEFFALKDVLLLLYIMTELNDNFFAALKKFHLA